MVAAERVAEGGGICERHCNGENVGLKQRWMEFCVDLMIILIGNWKHK